MTQVAEVPVELAPDSHFAMPYGQHYRKDDDGLPWQVDIRGGQESGLRKFVEEQIAEKTPVATIQVGPHQFRVYYKGGAWRAKGIVDGQLHRFSAPERDEVISKLLPFAKHDVIHDLTRSQALEISRLCQSGQKSEGIARYLEYRLGTERAERYANGSEMANDPELQDVMTECAFFTWLNSRADVRDSEEFRKFLMEYAGDRPINHDVCDAAWAAFLPHQEKEARKAAVAESRFVEREPTAQEVRQSLEDADDETIRRTFWATARQVTRVGG